jgi:hypothetical protein
MEPGGDDDAAWPEIWATRFKGAPVNELPASATERETKYLGFDHLSRRQLRQACRSREKPGRFNG